jgi:prepilin-type N-terminal cleavage/methylation domain-containing protein
MKIHRPSLHQSGLTLLELLVVLTILVVLSTVAITSTSGVADQARYEATQRSLENIRDAVIGPANQRDADGSLLITGFLADMGRLPHATSEEVDGGNIFILRELWENVNGSAPHTVRAAEEPNVNNSAEADPEVYLATGWRGPYLQLSPGNMTLRDGWAAEFVTPDGVVNGYPNALLRDPAGVKITAAGQSIGQVNSFGSDAIENGADTGYDRDLNVAFSTAQTIATVAVTFEVLNNDGTIATAASGGITTDKIFIRLFAPDPMTGLISVSRGEPVASISMGDPLTFTHEFGATPGPCVLRAYYNDGTLHKSIIVPVTLRAGGNTRLISVTVP